MDTYLPIETIQRSIYVVRGQKVMLDSELAALYGVPTHRLNEAVKRNLSRFPEDFMIQVTEDEWKNLISQFAISSPDRHGGRRSVPKAFTELGIAMLSSVLRSDHAVHVNIQIMRAFVAIRQALLALPTEPRLAALEDASRLHGDRLDAIETTLVAMEEKPQSVNIMVQGNMIGNSIGLGAVLDTLGAKAPQLGFDAADGDRFQNALQEARGNPPHTSRGRAALHTLKRMLESVAEHAGGAVVEHVVLAQLGRFLG